MAVQRHRTAISRTQLSRPVQLLLSYALLSLNDTFMDYGCGLGDDVRYLTHLGYKARGWDPVYFPETERAAADVVNLGYVLNVIEDPAERNDTLRDAFELSRRCLCVSALVGAATYTGTVKPYADGVLTSKGTFQKYFKQEEIAELLTHTTGTEPIPIEAGVFLLFRHESDQHEFVHRRIVRNDIPSVRSLQSKRHASIRSSILKAFCEKHPDNWIAYLQFVRENGRPPYTEEITTVSNAAAFGIRPAELFTAARQEVGNSVVEATESTRKTNLMVFLAISRIRRVPRLTDLPQLVRSDIRYHFGSYRNALGSSESRLFATGDRELVATLCEQSPVGVNTADGFFVPRKKINQLDPVLQINVRIGELFYGDLQTVDVVKIHKKSAKLSFFKFDDYEVKEHPVLLERTKIDLQSQQVRFFDHRSESDPEILIGKIVLEGTPETAEAPEKALSRRILAENHPFGTIIRQSVAATHPMGQ